MDLLPASGEPSRFYSAIALLSRRQVAQDVVVGSICLLGLFWYCGVLEWLCTVLRSLDGSRLLVVVSVVALFEQYHHPTTPLDLVMWSLSRVHLVLFRSAPVLCDSFVPLRYIDELIWLFGRELWWC